MLIVWKIGGLGDIGKQIVKINLAIAVLIVLVITMDRALMTYKWARLLRGRGLHLPFFKGLRIYCASMIWGMFLPATLGADAIRAYSTSQTGLNPNEVVASIVVERMVGFLSALLLGIISLVLFTISGNLDARFEFVWWSGIVMLLIGVLAFAASFSQRTFDFLYGCILHRLRGKSFLQRLRQFHFTYLEYQKGKANLAVFFGLTFIEQLSTVLHSWLIALGMGIQVSLLHIAGAVLLTMLISRIPVSIDGLGIYEGMFALLMSLSGVPPAQAVAISFAGRILQIIAWLPWWMAHVIGSGRIGPPQPIIIEDRQGG